MINDIGMECFKKFFLILIFQRNLLIYYHFILLDVIYAQRIVDGFSRHAHTGIGAFDLEGKVIDIPSKAKFAKVLDMSYFSILPYDYV